MTSPNLDVINDKLKNSDEKRNITLIVNIVRWTEEGFVAFGVSVEVTSIINTYTTADEIRQLIVV